MEGLNCLRTIYLGPGVQSIVSSMKLLVEDMLSLTILTRSIVVIFFPENCEELLPKAPHIFSAKNCSVFTYNKLKILRSC